LYTLSLGPPLAPLSLGPSWPLIWTRHASADRALDQVLGFLECRCE